jgi:hypothetical protein
LLGPIPQVSPDAQADAPVTSLELATSVGLKTVAPSGCIAWGETAITAASGSVRLYCGEFS